MRALRVAGIVLASFTILLVLAFIIAHASPTRRYVLSRVIQQLQSSGIDLQASNLDYNLLGGTVTLHNASVRSRSAPELPPIVAADYTHVQLAVTPLFHGHIVIRNAELRHPAIHLVTTADGRSNIPESGQPSTRSDIEFPTIDRLRIADASLTYEDQGNQLSLVLPKWQVSINGRPDGANDLYLDTQRPGRLVRRGRSLAINSIDLTGLLAAGTQHVEITKLSLDAQGINLVASGTLQGFFAPAVTAKAKSTIDLPTLRTFLAMKEKMSGTMSLRLAAEGTLPDLRLGLEANSTNLRVAGLTTLDVTADAHYKGDQRLLHLASLNMQTSNGGLSAKGDVALADTSTSSLDARLQQINLLRITRVLDLPMKVASTASGTISASFPGINFKQASGYAKLFLTKLSSLPSEKVLPLSGKVTATARNGAVTFQIGANSGPGLGELLAHPRFLKPAAFRTTNDSHLESAILRITLGRYRMLASDFSGARLLRANLPPRQQPTTPATTEPPDALNILSALLKGQVTLTPNGRISGQLTADFDDLQDTLHHLQLLLGRPTPLVPMPVHGRARAVVDLSGTTKDPHADLTFTAPGLTIGQLHGVAVALHVLYQLSGVDIRKAHVTFKDATIDAIGKVGLKGKNPPIDLTANLNRVSMQSLFTILQKQYSNASGILSGNARVTGTTSSPDADFTLRGDNVAAYNEPFGQIDARGKLRDSNLTLSQFTIAKPDGSKLNVTGGYNLSTTSYSLRGNAHGFTIHNLRLPNGKIVSTAIDLSATGRGTRADPQLKATLTAHALKFGGQDLGDLHADLDVANHRADLRAQAPRFNVNAVTSVGTDTPYPARFDVSVDRLDLSRLPTAVAETIKKNATVGTLTAHVQGTANLKNAAESADVTLNIPQLELTRNDVPIRLTQPLVAHYARRIVTVQPTTITAGASRVTIGGAIPMQAAGTASDLRINGLLDLASAIKLAPPSAQRFDTAGQVQLDVVLRGSLKQLAPEGTLSLRNGRVAGEQLPAPVENVNVQAAIGNGAATIQSLTAQFASSRVSASGRLPFSLLPASVPIARGNTNSPASFLADVKGFQFSSLKNTPKNINGLVSLHLEANAPQVNLHALQAVLRFDQLQLQLNGVPIDQEGISSLSIRNGRANIDHFQIHGPSTNLTASGSAEIAGGRALDLYLNGNTNAELASLFTNTVQMRGPIQMQIAVAGTVSAPNLQGNINLQNGIVSLRQPRFDATGLDLQLLLHGKRIDIAQLSGTLNGGTISGGGGVDLGKGLISTADVSLKGNDIYLEFPEGLRTVSNLNLNLRNDNENHLVLGGQVEITEGFFRRNINIEGEAFMQALQGGRGEEVELATTHSPFLERFRFNTELRTTSPILIDNNLARTGVETNLRLVGGIYNPSLLGRVELEQGGEIHFQQVDAVVERGTVSFVSETRIEPIFDILANMKASGYDITMQVTGPPDKTTTTFTSNPSLPQPDIISVLLFGRTLQDVRSSEVQVAQQQALSLLAGGLGNAISSSAQSALGLSQVRLEPSLLGGEANPTARLTVGEDLTRRLRLVYSMDVVNTDDRIIYGEFDVTHRFTTRATKQSDNSYRFDLNHDFRFGGIDNSDLRFRRPPERKIGSITFQGQTYFSQDRLREEFRLKPGDNFDFFKARQRLDKLQYFYNDRQFLEAVVRMHRAEQTSTVDLTIVVRPGKRVSLAYDGYQLPRSVQNDVREIWINGVFDLQRSQEASGAIHNELVRRNYIDAQIKSDIKDIADDQKLVTFHITPGTRYRDLKLEFPGAESIEPDELAKLIDKNHLREQTITNFEEVQKFLQSHYHTQGFLTAAVSESRLVTDPEKATARLIIPIDEGPQYIVGGLSFEGDPIFPYTELWHQVPELWSGRPYLPANRNTALLKLQTFYSNAGYNNATVGFRVIPHTDQGKVDIVFNIQPGKKSVVQNVSISGTEQTDVGLIRRQVLLEPGKPLNNDKLTESRVNLYETNAFQLVDINPVPVPGANTSDGTQPVDLKVNVREVEPFQWRYGGYYDTDRSIGVISDFSNHNTLGAGRVIGLYTRYDRDLQDARIYFTQPLLHRLPRSNFALYYTRETQFNPGTDNKTFINDHLGFTVDQEVRWKKDYVFTYGYQFERSRVIDLTPTIPSGDDSAIVAPLTFSFTRERRDDIVNPSRGNLISQGLRTGFGFLGSSQRYIKYTGQYNQYLSLNRPTQVPFKRAYRSRLVYAGAIRIGLAGGLGGQDLIQTEHFFAGGGTTIRGFEQDEVGPKDAFGNPIGGDALFILNNELRFPLWKWFDGVGFVDVGNVYRDFADFNPIDVRKAAGFGLRFYTPFVLIRADYGFKLDRRTGESTGAFFVSIGQAF